MTKLKVMTVIGTRPEIIKLSVFMKKADECFNHIIVHTGQNYDYELNKIFFDQLDLREPDCYLDVVGKDLGDTIGNIIAKSYTVLKKEKPDAVVVLGDTNSCLCVIAAKRLKIPVFHLEAGNRCFDENLPEEINRRIVDTVSDVNLSYSEHARRYLLTMGCDPARTFCVGSPMKEVLNEHKEKIQSSQILNDLNLVKNKYILLSSHREENIDIESNFISLVDSINKLADHFQLPILYSVHPRSKAMIKRKNIKFHPLVVEHKPFGFVDYIQLQCNAFCVVSDSGTLAEESALLGFPAVSLRTSTERPEVVDAGVFTLGMLSPDSLIQSINIEKNTNKERNIVIDYRDNYVSNKIIKIIQGYTAYVNKKVWLK